MSSEKQKLVTDMNNFVLKALKDFGLTDKEGEVYVYLAKSCPQKAINISKQLQMHKAQVYRILNNLRSKGLVKSTFEVPMHFEAVPFKSFLDLVIKTKKEEVTLLEENHEELLAHWNSINFECPAYRFGRFMIIEGRNNLYSRIFQMIERAEKEVLAVTNMFGLFQAIQIGLVDVLEKSKTRFRLLTNINKENISKIRPLLERLATKNSNLIINHVEFISGICPHFIMRDNEEAIIFLLPEKRPSIDSKHETGIWTNRPTVFYTKTFFEELWHKSININKRFIELESK